MTSPDHTATHHASVLLDEAIAGLNPCPGKSWADITTGGGGHLQALITATGGDGHYLALDRDREALARAKSRLGDIKAVRWVQAPFDSLKNHLHSPLTGGVLADLGTSAFQLEHAERGFSFRLEGPLDMRMDSASAGLTAADIVNTWDEVALAQCLWELGEERQSRPIARAMVNHRESHGPFETTRSLAELVAGVVRRRQPNRKEAIHPATRTFQALRMAVNDELGQLQRFLDAMPACLAPGARVAVITFHSLEDRLVKDAFRQWALTCTCPPDFPVCRCDTEPVAKIITRKPIVPSEAEVAQNPRARSAKLRVAERV